MTEAVGRKLFVWSFVGFWLIYPVLLMFYWPADTQFDVAHHGLGRDFVNVWSVPQIVARHGILSVFDQRTYFAGVVELFGPSISPYFWFAPPHAVLAAVPYGLLPYWPALIIWTVAGFALYAGAVLMKLAPADRTAGLIFLLLAPTTIVNIVGGQCGFFTAAVLIGGVAVLPSRPWLAGVLFGMLALKPHLALLLPLTLLAIGAWRTIAAAAVTAALLVAAPVAVWGVDPWIAWLTQTVPYAYHDLEQFQGFHIFMMPSVFASLRISGFSSDVAAPVQTAVTLAVAVLTAIAFRKTEDVGERALLLASGALLATPHVYTYDMPAMTAAMLWVMTSARSPLGAGKLVALIYGAAWVLPAAIWYLHYMHVGLSPLIIGAVYALTLAQVLRPRLAPNEGATAPQMV
jgi:hypothetical protein